MTELYSAPWQTAELRLCDREHACISARLAAIGVRYQHVELPAVAFDPDAERDEIIGSYLGTLDTLMHSMPWVTLDVTTVLPSHQRIASLHRLFMTEHAHDVTEAQMMVWGRGVLYMRAAERIWALHCEAGDCVRLPAQRRHWFEMDTRIGFRTVRLYEDHLLHGRIRWGRDMRGAYRLPNTSPSTRAN